MEVRPTPRDATAPSASGGRMRIVHVVDYLMPTMGYQEFLLPKWNAKRGHDVHIVTSDRYHPIPHYEDTWHDLLGPRVCGTGVETIEGVMVHRLPCIEVGARPWLRGLAATLRALSPDVVFCHGSSSLSAFRIARIAKTLGVPVLMDNHMTFGVRDRSLTGHLGYMALRVLSRRLLLPNVYRFLGVARECSDFLHAEQGIPRERIGDLPLGVDIDLFRPDAAARARVRAEHGMPEDGIVVLQTGRLSPEKEPKWLSRAMAPIMKRRGNVWLAFVGGGERGFLEEVKRPLADAGVLDRVRLIPYVPASELADYYAMADLCVYPAATSLSCMEAAVCERAVVMTDLDASRWRAELGVGICYRTGDVAHLERTLDELVGAPERRRALGARGRAAVLEHFSYDHIAAMAEELMREAMAARSREQTE